MLISTRLGTCKCSHVPETKRPPVIVIPTGCNPADFSRSKHRRPDPSQVHDQLGIAVVRCLTDQDLSALGDYMVGSIQLQALQMPEFVTATRTILFLQDRQGAEVMLLTEIEANIEIRTRLHIQSQLKSVWFSSFQIGRATANIK